MTLLPGIWYVRLCCTCFVAVYFLTFVLFLFQYFLAVDGYSFGTEEFQCPVYTEKCQCGASPEF